MIEWRNMPRLYNTLTRKKEELKAGPGRKLDLFVCGITPYDYPHIGNARTYVAFDALVRYLRLLGLKVFYLQNVTDVDDKIILRAKRDGKTWKEVARRFERVYLADMKALGVASVTKYARATDYIKEIISQVRRLEKKGFAYEIAGAGLYYNISRFKGYGKLSRRTSLQAEDAVSRIDESVGKRNKGDFALWKFSKKGEPAWNSPWGKGRPGWHIEDTAITENHFGPQYGLHGGAKDLIFPHHEAEIAQMEAISGKSPVARHWAHSGFLTSQGKKMSKSLGNFVTVEEFLAKHSPRVFRLLVLKAHYRSPIDYTENLLLQTVRELERLDEFAEELKSQKGKGAFPAGKFRKAFFAALDDDFNTPKALAALFDLVSRGNKAMASASLSPKDARAILASLKEADGILGFLFPATGRKKSVPAEIRALVAKREAYRKAKEWDKADEIRKTLAAKGWRVDDTPQGPRLVRRAGR